MNVSSLLNDERWESTLKRAGAAVRNKIPKPVARIHL
jgi:hypothetical protein